MNTYEIRNPSKGSFLGTFTAGHEAEALNKLAKSRGWRSFQEMWETTGERGIVVKRVA